jgi:hypothetical protein
MHASADTDTRADADAARRDILFLAADLCESTAFKDRNAGLDERGRPRWLEAFQAFFDGFPMALTTRIGLAYMDRDDRDMPEVRVWRTVGDEIVLHTDCPGPADAALVCQGFRAALTGFDGVLARRFGLRLKGAAWLVPVPHPNIEIAVPEIGDESRGAAAREVLGPDMDIGFRVKSRTVEGQMSVSLNLACRLTEAPDVPAETLRLVERVRLKGVGGGFAYPMILYAPEARHVDGLSPDGDRAAGGPVLDGILEGTLRLTPAMLEGLARGYARAAAAVQDVATD